MSNFRGENPIFGSVQLNPGGLFLESFQDSITAHAGGTQAAAFPLTSEVNRVSTVATAGDSVKLPPSQQGLTVILINSGANPMQVFGSGADTINSIATATGVSQGAATVTLYTCPTLGNWTVPINSLSTTVPIAIAASGAVSPHVQHTYAITKAGVAALTLAAPTAGVDDGLEIQISSTTAFAHTLTATGLFQTGSASVNLATFAASAGAGLSLLAFNAKWIVLASVGITFS